MSTDEAAIRDWLTEFQGVVRARDFAAGHRFFAEDAVAFGTWARAVSSSPQIEQQQWRQVWPRIRAFSFDADPLIRIGGDLAWIATTWTSEATGPDGRAFPRPGRATFVLARRDGRWVCVHSHLSLLPSQSDSAHGRLAP
jgi:ketosteroid isomerase-like protein